MHGQGGSGKGSLLLYLSALSSNGKLWLDGLARDVLFLSAEEDSGSRVRTMVLHHGGEPGRVFAPQLVRDDDTVISGPAPVSAWQSLEALEGLMVQRNFGLIVLDPVRIVAPARSEDALRESLLQLGAMASEAETVIIGLAHNAKGGKRKVADEDFDPVELLRDSGAYVDHSRRVLTLAEGEDGQRYVQCRKTNLGGRYDTWRMSFDLDDLYEEDGKLFQDIGRVTLERADMDSQDFIETCYRKMTQDDRDSEREKLMDTLRMNIVVGPPMASVSYEEVRALYLADHGKPLSPNARIAGIVKQVFPELECKKVGGTNRILGAMAK